MHDMYKTIDEMQVPMKHFIKYMYSEQKTKMKYEMSQIYQIY